MRTLRFTYQGDSYSVNEVGHIKANGLHSHSPNWIFRGGSRHHMNNHVTVTLQDAFREPSLLNGCYGWDIDHGTERAWRSRSGRSIARIWGACVS